MIKSMTGYGRSETRGSDGTVVAELRSVNHRHLEVSTRLPHDLAALEPALKKRFQDRFARGRLDLTVTVRGTTPPRRVPVLDVALARAYHARLAELRDSLGLRGEVDLGLLAGLRDVISVTDGEPAPLTTLPVEEAVEAAIGRVAAMRANEGRAIAKEFAKRLGLIERALRRIEARVPRATAAHRARLRRRIEELTGPHAAAVDAGRLTQELIAWADRSDISEEVQRLRSHIGQFRQMTGRAKAEAVGKSLDFLVQEMNREINTIGSKADDAAVALRVVEVKSELEKIREQVQNVE